jgi:LacI family transcriptional regulator
MSTSRLTLESIAELAGVSRSTVSRVVNNHSGVRPEVRERVLHVIEETGYQPDPAARRLAGQRANVLGLVIAEPAQALFADPYFPRLIQGITQKCNALDQTLSLFLFHKKEEEAKLYPRILHNKLVDGLLVTGTHDDDPLVPQLIENNSPFVMIGRHDNPNVTFIDVDNVAGAHSAVTHLIRLGRHRIAIITGHLNNRAAQDRYKGYINALQDRNVPFDETLVEYGDYTEISAYEAMQRLMQKNIDAVFACSDSMAVGALRALQEAHISVPGQVAIVGFDDLPPASRANPQITTVRQPIFQVGALAVETLLDILDTNLIPVRRLVLPTELIIRQSCGANII